MLSQPWQIIFDLVERGVGMPLSQSHQLVHPDQCLRTADALRHTPLALTLSTLRPDAALVRPQDKSSVASDAEVTVFH